MEESSKRSSLPSPESTHFYIPPPRVAIATIENMSEDGNPSASASSTTGNLSGKSYPPTLHTTQGTRVLGKDVGENVLDGTPNSQKFHGNPDFGTNTAADHTASEATANATEVNSRRSAIIDLFARVASFDHHITIDEYNLLLENTALVGELVEHGGLDSDLVNVSMEPFARLMINAAKTGLVASPRDYHPPDLSPPPAAPVGASSPAVATSGVAGEGSAPLAAPAPGLVSPAATNPHLNPPDSSAAAHSVHFAPLAPSAPSVYASGRAPYASASTPARTPIRGARSRANNGFHFHTCR
jgi:hypothetical protein